MSAGTLSLSPQEAIARDRIVERVAAAHHAHHVPEQAGRIRRHVRAALLLRSLAERLDPSAERPARAPAACTPLPAPHAGARVPGRRRLAGPRTGTAEPRPPPEPVDTRRRAPCWPGVGRRPHHRAYAVRAPVRARPTARATIGACTCPRRTPWTTPTSRPSSRRTRRHASSPSVPTDVRTRRCCPCIVDGDRVIGHLARANDHWTRIAPASPGLVVVSGADAYVSPGWYATKAEHGRVVPTWNYSEVQLRGAVTVHDDPDWVLDVVTRLTERHEAGREQPVGRHRRPGRSTSVAGCGPSSASRSSSSRSRARPS